MIIFCHFWFHIFFSDSQIWQRKAKCDVTPVHMTNEHQSFTTYMLCCYLKIVQFFWEAFLKFYWEGPLKIIFKNILPHLSSHLLIDILSKSNIIIIIVSLHCNMVWSPPQFAMLPRLITLGGKQLDLIIYIIINKTCAGRTNTWAAL